jgi:Zn-dependent M28 family amino/carboxypeptidase
MHRTKAILIAAACLTAWPALAAEFSGARALEYTRQAVAFGPRPPGSPAIRRMQAWMVGQLKGFKCEVIEDAFTAQTPRGSIAMKNIIARFKGTSGRAVAFTGHYDTKYFTDRKFVGADDGGSSAGFLLEMARALNGRVRKDDVYLVWFDGEEAFGEWTATDSLYGSRHLAERWAREGVLGRLRALINVDMIGDKNLGIMQETNSSASLRRMVWETAERMGYGKYFLPTGGPTEDDHIPFLKRGVNALDLIDFDKDYWHTPQDTMDKLSAHSFDVVGAVLLQVLRQLEG